MGYVGYGIGSMALGHLFLKTCGQQGMRRKRERHAVPLSVGASLLVALHHALCLTW